MSVDSITRIMTLNKAESEKLIDFIESKTQAKYVVSISQVKEPSKDSLDKLFGND